MTIEKIKDIKSLIAEVRHIHDFDKSALRYNWITGGMACGPEYGSSIKSKILDEGDPESDVFAEILGVLAPTINNKQYHELTKVGLWSETTGTDFGQYGDYEEYIEKTLNVDVLFERLNALAEA